MNKILLFLSFGILSCQSGPLPPASNMETKQSVDTGQKFAGLVEERDGYPRLIDSLGLQKEYDETKWKVYLLSCADTPKTDSNNYILKPALPFGSYDLFLDSLVKYNDTLVFYFDYYDQHKEAINVYKYRDLMNDSYNGLMFYPKKSVLTNCFVSKHFNPWMICAGIQRKIRSHKDSLEFKAYYDTITDRLFKPLQPDVALFIQKHKRELNPWLYKEAIKRGVLVE